MSGAILSLDTRDASLVVEAADSGPPIWRHFGRRVDTCGLGRWEESWVKPTFAPDNAVPLTTFPLTGRGWFGPVAIEASRGDAPLALSLPHPSVSADRTEIVCDLSDESEGLALRQRLATDGPIFRLSASLTNTGTEPLRVDWLASALLPLPPVTTLLSWRGRHNAELIECREPMPGQQWRREGRRGISGHGGPPGLYVLEDGAGWHDGLVVAAQLAWSGDALLAVERLDDGRHVLSAGARLASGECVLAPGERLDAPELLLAVSTAGRNGAARAMHQAVRSAIIWPGGAMRPRPVHLNSWEACYFDHDADRMSELAEAAAAIGIERFVLDDGWFVGRTDDQRALGDWRPDPVKYPNGLKPVAAKVRELGMEFGLWVEPEMVSPDSDLHRAHPEWTLAPPRGEPPTGRNQLVLDLRREEVRDYLFGSLDRLLREVPITYLKWDHNRDLAPPGGRAQVEGTYDLIRRLRAAHPAVEIEGCAGGGGRSDAGLAQLVHRFWTSDNLDAVSRSAMQRGFLSFLPPEMMGAHVGASPAHGTGRSQSLDFRAAIAFGGHFGVELDPRALSEPERAVLTDWIAFYKEWRALLHGSAVWQGDAADGLHWEAFGSSDRAMLKVWRTAPPLDAAQAPLPLPWVRNDATYRTQLLRVAGRVRGGYRNLPPLFARMRDEGVELSGAWIAAAGLPLPWLDAESAAFILLERTQ